MAVRAYQKIVTPHKSADEVTTLYATDLDGTLLDADATLSDYSARMFRRLTAQGALITFVTARTPATIEPILAKARPSVPGVAMTGSTIWNPESRSYEAVDYLSRRDVDIIKRICAESGINPFVYTLLPGSNQLVSYHSAPVLSALEQKFVYERSINDLKIFKIGEDAPVESEACTVLFFAMGEPSAIRTVAEAIRRATDCYASWYPDTYHPGLSLLEVFAPQVSKAYGLRRLKERLGADRVVAFGDNLNDIPMLQTADLAVAVDNAAGEVKQAANIIIGPNTADSVMDYIAADFHAMQSV